MLRGVVVTIKHNLTNLLAYFFSAICTSLCGLDDRLRILAEVAIHCGDQVEREPNAHKVEQLVKELTVKTESIHSAEVVLNRTRTAKLLPRLPTPAYGCYIHNTLEAHFEEPGISPRGFSK